MFRTSFVGEVGRLICDDNISLIFVLENPIDEYLDILFQLNVGNLRVQSLKVETSNTFSTVPINITFVHKIQNLIMIVNNEVIIVHFLLVEVRGEVFLGLEH